MSGKRLTTLLGLVLILSGAVAGVLFVSRQTDFFPRARPEYIPQKVKVTNITDTGFTVSWFTAEPTIGFVKYGLNASDLSTTSNDERDQLTGDSGDFKTHYITVQGLKAATPYFFKLGSHGKQLYDNNGQAFTLTTAPAIEVSAVVDSIYGTVLTPAQTPAEGSLIYLSLPGAVPISALVKQNGNWTVNLANVRALDLNSYVTYDPQTTAIDILVRDTDGNASEISATTANDQPVPTIVLGQESTSTTTSTNNGPLPESKFSLKPIVVTDPDSDTTIAITTPNQEGAVLNSIRPAFKGKAPANVTLAVTLQSMPVYTQSISADAAGNWSWTPPGSLTPGVHTLTIAYNDVDGILHTLTRSFTVQAASSGLTYSATPSASLAPTNSPIPTATTRPTSTPRITAVPTLPTTPVPTNLTILSPSPIPTPALPGAGSTSPTFTLIFGGLLLTGLGLILIRFHLNSRL